MFSLFMMLLLRKYSLFFLIGLLILYTRHCSNGRLDGWKGKSDKVSSSILFIFIYRPKYPVIRKLSDANVKRQGNKHALFGVGGTFVRDHFSKKQ